jgi:hypothetical protein
MKVLNFILQTGNTSVTLFSLTVKDASTGAALGMNGNVLMKVSIPDKSQIPAIIAAAAQTLRVSVKGQGPAEMLVIETTIPEVQKDAPKAAVQQSQTAGSSYQAGPSNATMGSIPTSPRPGVR